MYPKDTAGRAYSARIVEYGLNAIKYGGFAIFARCILSILMP